MQYIAHAIGVKVLSYEFNIFVTLLVALFQKLDGMPPTVKPIKQSRTASLLETNVKTSIDKFLGWNAK